LTRNTELQSNHFSSRPPKNGPRPMPTAANADQMPIAFARSLAREDVGDDREGRGHDQRAADAHQDADGDQLVRGVDDEHAQARAAEQQEAELERPLAAEPVAEGAHREQQPGEGQQVGVDHPLERRAGGVELLLEARQGDVQDRVVEPDDQEAQGQDGERLPPPCIDLGRDRKRKRLAVGEVSRHVPLLGVVGHATTWAPAATVIPRELPGNP
jgi:hypothetical protein